MKNLNKSSHNVLNRYTAKRLVGDTLFARLGRVVCEAECLPRKEFYEAWEVAKRVRRHMRGGQVIELAAGHGLLSAMLIINAVVDKNFLTEKQLCEPHQCLPVDISISSRPPKKLGKNWPDCG